ncbi:hypothetical protein J3F83DRAFT_289978 [Trichoderma novae-zelandiae]
MRSLRSISLVAMLTGAVGTQTYVLVHACEHECARRHATLPPRCLGMYTDICSLTSLPAVSFATEIQRLEGGLCLSCLGFLSCPVLSCLALSWDWAGAWASLFHRHPWVLGDLSICRYPCDGI